MELLFGYARYMLMRLSRLSAAIALFTILLASNVATASAKASGGVTKVTSVRCAAGRGFELQQGDREATVSFDQRVLRFEKHRSSIGRAYHSAQGALIVDEDYVVLVLSNDLAFEDCYMAKAAKS